MRQLLAILVLVIISPNVFAQGSLLDRLGLSGFETVTVEEASEVTGRGFVSSFGVGFAVGGIGSYSSPPGGSCAGNGSPPIDPDVVSGDASFSACQHLQLEGLSRLNGLVAAVGSFDGEFSDNVGGMFEMAMTVLSSSGTGATFGSAH